MKKLFIFMLAATFVACGSKKEKEDDDTKEKAATSINTSGYTLDYSSSFAMGDNKNAETILALWKAWDDNKLASGNDYFADSVEMHFYSGEMMKGPRDSAMAGAQAYRNSFTSVKSQVHAIFPVMSTDKNENWVCIWGTEVHTDKAGKTDSVHLQETWRFNKAGKADLLYQYSAMPVPASK